MSDIPLQAKVQCSDVACGKSTNVIVNPVNLQVSHIVVEDKKLPNYATRLVSVDKIAGSTPDQITLSCTRDEVAAMQPFIVDTFVQESPSGLAYASGDAYTSEYVVNDTGYDDVAAENMPKGELGIYSGMEIEASDGKIGKLDELVLDPKSGAITHLQMREGHLWGKKDVAIAVSDIDFTDGKAIYLKINKEAVKALPPIKVKRK
jgi:sporulation protein YlmC with PRC-barrel domain